MTKLVLLVVALAAAATAGAAAKPSPGFAGCNAYVAPKAKLAVRPAQIVAACGDGNFYFTGLRWSVWTVAGAHARGTAHQNDCTPNCAAGHFHAYPAAVALGALKSCHGRLEFTRLTWTLAAGKHGTETFRCA